MKYKWHIMAIAAYKKFIPCQCINSCEWVYIKSLLYAPNKDQMLGCLLLFSWCLLQSFMEKTIKKVARRGNYLFYSQTVLIDLIRDSRPFRETRNTLYRHVTPLHLTKLLIVVKCHAHLYQGSLWRHTDRQRPGVSFNTEEMCRHFPVRLNSNEAGQIFELVIIFWTVWTKYQDIPELNLYSICYIYSALCIC